MGRGVGGARWFGCWKCAINYSKNCSLGRIPRSQVAASRNMPQDRPTQSRDDPTYNPGTPNGKRWKRWDVFGGSYGVGGGGAGWWRKALETLRRYRRQLWGGGGGGQGDLQTFGGQNRCWKCAKNTVNYSKNCSLGRITRSQVAASRNMPQDRPTQSQDGPT